MLYNIKSINQNKRFFVVENIVKCRKIIYLIIFYFLCNSNKSITIKYISPDTLLADTNNYWHDKTNYILIGTDVNYKDYKITFLNNTANLLGILEVNCDNLNLRYRDITTWKFYPTINQTNASVFLTTKFGNLGVGKSINDINNSNITKTALFSFSTSYKKFGIDFNYLKFTGLNRVEPLYKTTSFLNNMTFNPISLNLLYNLRKKIETGLLYIPKKANYTLFVIFGLSMLNVKNNNDFIPALRLKNNKITDTIDLINNVYLNKFESKGISIGTKYSFLLPIIKAKNIYKPKVLYLKGDLEVGYSYQSFAYKTMVDTITTTQQKLFSKGFGILVNYKANANLNYDFDKFIFGFNVSYGNQSYGNLNNGSLKTTNNHVEDIRLNYNGFICFRINCTKTYAKIENFKQNVLD